MSYDIVAIGNILRETVVYQNEIIGPVLGGPSAYVSILLGRLGFRISIVSYAGPDLETDFKHQFRTVDCSGILPCPHTTENHLIYEQNETNSVEYTQTAPYITLKSIPESLLDAKRYFIGPMNYEVEPDILEYLHDKGKEVFTDLGGFGGTTCHNHFSYKSSRGKKLLDMICKCSCVIKASSDDLILIFPGLNISECVDLLLRDNVELVVITLGKDGTAYKHRGGEYTIIPAMDPECPPNSINSVGGGDAVMAGLVAYYEGTETAHEAVQYGQSIASLILEHRGGCEESRFPTSISLLKRLNKVVNK